MKQTLKGSRQITKWTKKEIKALQFTLTSYLVICRDRFGCHPDFANLFTKQINEKRKEIITAGLRDRLKVWYDYAKQHRDYVEHCKAHPEAFSSERSRLDSIAKSEGFAVDDEKQAVWFEKLISRIESEDLPSDVQEFNPLA